MPSPVWFAVDETGLAYLKTRRDAGKVKRLRNDNRVLIALSNSRGKPTGPAIKGTGRVLRKEEWAQAEETCEAPTDRAERSPNA